MVTKTYLRHRVNLLNKRLGRFEAGWTRANDRTLTANVGHLALEENSPGDGWTRYRLVETTNVNGGENNIGPSCNVVEMSAFLDGVEAGLELSNAEGLLDACESVLAWAKAPGDHAGNPYTETHVNACMTAVAQVRGVVDKWSL